MPQWIGQLWQDKTQLVVVTHGEKGCEAFTKDLSWKVNGYSVQVEDTIGASDGFVAGLLSGLLALGKDWEKQDLQAVLQRANAVGALAASQHGGIPAMPNTATLEKFMKIDRG